MNDPTANLRITFWGVQGSVPIFPTRDEVREYAEGIATATLRSALNDLAGKAERGECTSEMLRALALPPASAQYQKALGLPELPTYGGDTTCVEVLTGDGDTLLFDMGTGLRDFSRQVTADWEGRGPRTLHVFASHEHLDHRSGISFASFCLERKHPFTVHVYGTHAFLAALDDRYGLYSHRLTDFMHVDDPLDYRVMAATFTGSEIRIAPTAGDARPPFDMPVRRVGEPISIGATTVTPFEVYHGITQCLAYKVVHKTSTFVFCTDHELRHGTDPADPRQIKSLAAERRLLDQCQNADAVYMDGQYFLDEYKGVEGIGSSPGLSRMDWGHSCIEDVIARVQQCNIRQAFIGHHDPERLWGSRVELDRHLQEISRGQPYQIQLAKAGDSIEVCDRGMGGPCPRRNLGGTQMPHRILKSLLTRKIQNHRRDAEIAEKPGWIEKLIPKPSES